MTRTAVNPASIHKLGPVSTKNTVAVTLGIEVIAVLGTPHGHWD
ncbi:MULTISPECIES: hypothetical protein [Acidithiobacillus]|nr:MULTISPECIES: hypothetical protein [Acidithiobacillus]MCY0872310.1 hypothetical protein [Acidithiobacillus caldus]WMT46890.1 MAG: hypothetical protein RE468_13585 [Acidithiobacillus caldus]